jgi:YesN/AraC family two-component response regulator
VTVVTAMIADDEAPMRDLLRARLQAVWPELRIVAEAANGIEAVALGEQHRPTSPSSTSACRA